MEIRNRNKFSVVVLRILAVVFLGMAIIIWVYGSGSHQSVDALLIGIAAIVFVILSFYMSNRLKKRS